MRRTVIMLLVAMLTLAGCAGDRGKELLDTARFEEQQHNQEHAVQLYRQIVKKYPGSSAAEQANKRLAELGGKP